MKKFGIFVLFAALVVGAASARADGDAEAGKKTFAGKCGVCHSPEAGKNKIGPSLFGVVGRKSATIADFNYSDPMKAANKTWDPATLNEWLTSPKTLVPGTKMIFQGFPSQTDRDNVIAYLSTLK
jgi:cytochrome c